MTPCLTRVTSGGRIVAIAGSSLTATHQSFVCWRRANAPILPGRRWPLQIDCGMPLQRQATSIRNTVEFSSIRKRTGKYDGEGRYDQRLRGGRARRCIQDRRSRPFAYSVSLCRARGHGFDNRCFGVHKVLKSQVESLNWRSHSTPRDLAPQCKNGRTISVSVKTLDEPVAVC